MFYRLKLNNTNYVSVQFVHFAKNVFMCFIWFSEYKAVINLTTSVPWFLQYRRFDFTLK